MRPSGNYNGLVALCLGFGMAGAMMAPVGAVAQTFPAADKQTWELYVNGRFGAEADVPTTGFVAQEPPDNDDGRGWLSEDGKVDLRVTGAYWNVPADTFKEYVAETLSYYDDDEVTYNASGDDWYAISGYLQNGDIFYTKGVTKNDCPIVGKVWLTYPREFQDGMAGIVERMADTLALGPSDDCPD